MKKKRINDEMNLLIQWVNTGQWLKRYIQNWKFTFRWNQFEEPIKVGEIFLGFYEKWWIKIYDCLSKENIFCNINNNNSIKKLKAIEIME